SWSARPSVRDHFERTSALTALNARFGLTQTRRVAVSIPSESPVLSIVALAQTYSAWVFPAPTLDDARHFEHAPAEIADHGASSGEALPRLPPEMLPFWIA